MATAKNTAKVENEVYEVHQEELPEDQPAIVLKDDYDKLLREYQRVVAAFNKAMIRIGEDYANKYASQLFAEVDANK